ncbi:4Fe-4S binding protein [Methanobrevibacter sp. OttesenSCG-928-K11]|nr:4Fe-4S binding protein [Methanobrevibacter sp. OttesenSCG-928-K11]MDL2270908.1 4Fe-4S binding protein [Methanobrevibacter sp. OttesenSCG-928-I08]
MFLSTNNCEGIGECIKECPTKAIRLINGKAFSCLTCGTCYEKCPNNAIFINKYGGYVVDRAKCNGCGICMFNCPTNNINIDDGVVYGVCSRCGLCVDACPTKSRVDGFSLMKDKQINYINSLDFTIPKYDFPEKSETKEVERSYYGTDLDKCIFCGRCEHHCPNDAIEVEADLEEGICTKCRICEDVCPTNSIKKFTINHETCVLCYKCIKSCPHNAIYLNDSKVFIEKLNQKTNGNIVSCLNCGLCAEVLDNDSLKQIDGKLRYDPTKDIVNGIVNHYDVIKSCPVSTLKESDELFVVNEEGSDDVTLSGFCVSCGNCIRACDSENARKYEIFTWDGTVSDDCISCGICYEVCPEEAITLYRGKVEVNLDKCILCENCAIHCPKNAIVKTTMAKKILAGGFNQIDEKLCISCGLCYKICPEDAINENNNEFTVNEEKCIYCGACKNACPSNAFIFDRKFKDSVDGA